MKSLTVDEVRAATGIDAVETNELGQLRFAASFPANQRKVCLRLTHAAYKRKDIGWRLMLGNMVNDLRLPYGDKRQFCINEYGDQGGQTLYGYANTAAHWNDERQDHKLPWTLYKEAGLLTSDEKHKVICHFVSREWDLDKCCEYCREWKAEHKPRNSAGISSAPEQRNSAILSTTSNSREFLDIEKAVRYASTRADAIAYRDAAAQRVMDFDQDDIDDFADGEGEGCGFGK